MALMVVGLAAGVHILRKHWSGLTAIYASEELVRPTLACMEPCLLGQLDDTHEGGLGVGGKGGGIISLEQ